MDTTYTPRFGVADTGYPGAKAPLGFSLVRALSLVDADPAGHAWRSSYEAEISDATSRAFGAGTAPGVVYVPLVEPQRRDMTVGSAGAGGYLVGTSNPGTTFLQSLQAASVLFRAGAQRLPITRDDAAIPVVTSAPAVGWLGDESTQIGATQPTIGSRAAQPKHVAARVTFAHQLAAQAPMLTEQLLLAELGRAVAAELDRVALAGSGASGEPLGVANVPGIQSASGGSIDWAGLHDAVGDVRETKVAGEPSFVTTPAVAELLGTRERASGSGRYLAEDDRAAGRPLYATTGAPSATLFCADWSQLYVATWGALQVLVDPFTGWRTGSISMRVLLPCDVFVAHPSTFVVRTGVN